MALNAAIKWEVRTTGATTNGGGYKTGATGTNYSQQDAAQYALTTATTAGANAIILDASAAAVMVGNVLYVVSGTNFTPGFYEITSVSVGVSITVDRNCTTGAGALGVINIGGAQSNLEATCEAAVMSNTVYVKYGTYTITGNITLVDSSVPNSSPLCVLGYKTTRGDYPKLADRPTITTTTALSPMVSVSGNNQFGNFILTTSGGTPATAGVASAGTSSRGGYVYNVKVSGIATGFESIATFFCEATGCVKGFSYPGTSSFCYSHDNSGDGFTLNDQNSSGTLFNCIADSNSSDGFYMVTTLSNSFLFGCIAYNNTAYGIANNGSYSCLTVLNCIASTNGGTGIATLTKNTASGLIDYNCIYNNGTARSGYVAGANEVTGNPNFTDPANGDFTLGAGSSCLNVGKNISANEGVVGSY